MKKLMCLMVALLVAPAMATITVEIVDNGDCTADIVVTADGTDVDANGSLLAGIALDLSVDNGAEILSVVAAKEGESTAADPGYGIFMGTITFIVVGEDTQIDDAGSCVAPSTAPDNPGTLPGPLCTVEFGCLYNVNVVADAPLAITTLATVTVDGGCTLTAVLDDARGQYALIGGGAPSGVAFVGGAIAACVSGDCYEGQPDRQEWLDVGEPLSWCDPYQCYGDVNNQEEIVGWVPVPPPNGTDIYASVGPTDLSLFLSAYRVPVGQPGQNLAADVNHLAEVVGWVPVPPPNGTDVLARTGPTDLGLLLGSYRVPTDQLTRCGNPQF